MTKKRLLVLLVVLAGCGGDATQPGATTPAIGLSLEQPSLSIAIGFRTNVLMTLTRTNYTGDVSLSLDGAPDGMTALVSPGILTGGMITAGVTVAPGNADVGNPTLTIHAKGDGVAEQRATLRVAITNPVSGFAITLTPSTLSVAQGGSAIVALTIQRLPGFVGAVSFVYEGLPTGVVLGPNTIGLTASNSGSINLLVTGSAVPGTYTINVRSLAIGLEVVSPIHLTVTK
jgi:hypothetical protein